MNRWMCGVPEAHCNGAMTKVNARLRGACKTHGSPEQAFECRAKYLVNVEGYEKIGAREFRREGEPVLVLTKKSRYGARLRTGKMNERVQPRRGSGVIIG